MKADLRSEGDAALAALAAERMSLWERAGPADWGDPPLCGPVPCGAGAMERAPSGARFLHGKELRGKSREQGKAARRGGARGADLVYRLRADQRSRRALLREHRVRARGALEGIGAAVRVEAGLELRRALARASGGQLPEAARAALPAAREGKARRISAVHFRDRVVQKSLCKNSLIPLLSRGLVFDNSATLKGRGTEFARTRFAKHLRRAWGRWGSAGYLVHYDFRSYFESIDQKRAMSRLEGKLLGLCRNEKEVLSARRVLWLTRQFVCEEERGLGLGNQTSQIVAVEYASPIDHMICEVLRLGLSGRYMDDGYAFCPDGDTAREALGAIEAKAASLGLALHPRKCGVEPASREHVFLKYTFRVDGRSGQVAMAPVAETLRRYRRRHLRLCRLAAAGAIGIDAVEASEASFGSAVKLATERERLEAEMAGAFAKNRGHAGLDGLA